MRFQPPHISFIQGSTVFIAEMFYALSYSAMGWLLATRLPRNLLGWMFLVLGLSWASQLTMTFVDRGRLPGVPPARDAVPVRRLGSILAPPALLVVLTAVVFLRFPTGKLLSSAGRSLAG